MDIMLLTDDYTFCLLVLFSGFLNIEYIVFAFTFKKPEKAYYFTDSFQLQHDVLGLWLIVDLDTMNDEPIFYVP